MTEILWLGHATFFIKTNGISILIDPWLDNPKVYKLEIILKRPQVVFLMKLKLLSTFS